MGRKIMSVRRSLILAVLGAFVAVYGCTGKREQAEQRTEATPRGESPATPEGTLGGRTAADSTSSVIELFSRIHQNESELSQIITAGRLNEVGQKAFLIRDLLATAAGRANVPLDQRAALEQHVSAVSRVAIALGNAGRAGNQDETKAQNSELQRELGIVERMVGQAGGD
jgi:hypothetical protein